MKTTLTQKMKSIRLCGALIIVFLCFSFKTNAQCLSGFTFAVDSANNGNVAFTNTSTGSGLFYSWNFGDGTSSSLLNPGTHTYASSGTYTACLTIYDSVGMFDSTMGCFSTYCSTFTVINPAGGGGSCNASFVGFDSAGYGYFMNTSVGPGITSSWTFGDGSSGTSTGDITHFYSSPGTYIVCLTISNFAGSCTDVFCDSITIGTGTTGSCLGIVDPTFTYTETSGTANFTNTVSGSSPVYFWDFGDGSNSSAVGSTSHTYTSNGTYLVCLTVYETAGGTDSCQYCSYVNVSGVPMGCSLSMTVVQDSTNLFNYYVYYSATTPSGSMTYFWDFGDGSSSTLAYPSHTYASTTPVVLCLTISDGVACSMTDCDSITPGMMMSSTFTLTAVNPLSVAENLVLSSFENYPNPFSENTTVNFAISEDAEVSLSVSDLLGNKVAELENGKRSAGEYSSTWNAENVSGGMYLLQLKVNNEISVKKIIVNR